jgi:hypothetical protein
MVANLNRHILSTGRQGVEHWSGATNWNVTVNVSIRYTGYSVNLAPMNFRATAGLFTFNSRSFTLNNFKPEEFTLGFAYAAARGLIEGDDDTGLARQGRGNKKDDKEYNDPLTEKQWDTLEPTFDLVRKAINNPDCAKWLTSNVTWASRPDPLGALNTLISKKHFFYGGKPGSYATTYSNGGKDVSFATIGLRQAFFDDSKWGKVNTILHELRHAMHLGKLGHSDGMNEDEIRDRMLRGDSLETQAAFNSDVEANCISSLRKANR